MFTSSSSRRLLLLCFMVTLWAAVGLWDFGAANDGLIANKPVTEDCLECLCEAMSDCNDTKICVNGACGIFRITWGFWQEAGSLTLPDESSLSQEAFTNCVNDPICAADTIQKYMFKHGEDCNGDERIDCLDFGALHKLGKLGCQGELPYTFGRLFNRCLKRKQREEKAQQANITK